MAANTIILGHVAFPRHSSAIDEGSTGISAPPSEPSSELDRNLSLDWYKWFSRYELVRVWGAGSSVPQKDS